MRAAFFGLRVEGVPRLHARVQTFDIGDVRSGQQALAAARWPPSFTMRMVLWNISTRLELSVR